MSLQPIHITSWNVNGFRAVMRKGFTDWFNTVQPDILCLQEVKAREEQVAELLAPFRDYRIIWNAAERPGYSGVAMWMRREPIDITTGLGNPQFDREGRVITAEFDDFILINAYFPNGQRSLDRLDYKLDFYRLMIDTCRQWKAKGKSVVVVGDFNTAHQEIDLKNPKENSGNSGFLLIEREWVTRFLESGFVDVFREQYPGQEGHYTWWTYRNQARERNIGWRIDYFLLSPDLMPRVTGVSIHPQVLGSDHCPISLQLTV